MTTSYSLRTPDDSGASAFWMMLLVLFVGTGISFLLSWNWIESTIFESDPPIIEVIEIPKGLGSSTEQLRVSLRDEAAGLDEVVIRFYKRGAPIELFREKLGGVKNIEKSFQLGTKEQALSEGIGEVEIRAFDRSFYSNRAQTRFSLTVDQSKPRLEPITTQHNMTVGGSQLAFYRASDNTLAKHGVLVGELSFYGLPAQNFDESITDRNIYGVLFSSTMANPKTAKIKLFAEDAAGNLSVLPLNQKVAARSFKSSFDSLTANQLATAFPHSEKKLRTKESITNLWNGSRELVAALPIEPELQCALTSFKKMPGDIRTPFGATVTYELDGQDSVDRATGYRIQLGAEGTVVRAAAAGMVLSAGFLDGYGESVVIDHGCGLKTVYAGLQDIKVTKGSAVEADEVIAALGTQALSARRELLFETWVQSVPVDAREWWDSSWTSAHITAKIDDVKKTLGIDTGEW